MKAKRGVSFGSSALAGILSLNVLVSQLAGASEDVDLNQLGETLLIQVSQVQAEETLGESSPRGRSAGVSMVPESLRVELSLEAEGLKETGTLKMVGANSRLVGEPEVLSTHPDGSPKEVQYEFLF